MTNIYICENNNEYKIKYSLNLSCGGIEECKINTKLNSSAILNLKINKSIGSVYDYIIDNIENIAIRVTDVTNDIDIAFYLSSNSIIQDQDSLSITFSSYIDKIRTNPAFYTFNTDLSNFNQEIISNLAFPINCEFIGENRFLNYNTGTKNNLELINEICEKTQYSYIEKGFKSSFVYNNITGLSSYISQPTILFGDFENKNIDQVISYYTHNNDFIFSKIVKKISKINPKYTSVIGTKKSNGTGSLAVSLSQSSQIDSFYPIVNLQNTSGLSSLYIEDYEQNNNQYSTISIPLWDSATAQDLYVLAVIEIEKRKIQEIYEIEMVGKKLTAGTKLKINIQTKKYKVDLVVVILESVFDCLNNNFLLSVSKNTQADPANLQNQKVKKLLKAVSESQSVT